MNLIILKLQIHILENSLSASDGDANFVLVCYRFSSRSWQKAIPNR